MADIMTLPDPHILINFKAYDGTAARNGLALLEQISDIQQRTGASFVVAPQIADLSLSAKESDIPVIAQVATAGNNQTHNGKVPIQTVAASGAAGVVVNHPENERSIRAIEREIAAANAVGIESIVCVNSIEMGRAVLEFGPDWLLFERPADIASGNSLAETAPDRVEQFVSMVEENEPDTRVMLGGGISDGKAVAEAFRCGVNAAGAASAFVDADDKKAWLSEVANGMNAISNNQ